MKSILKQEKVINSYANSFAYYVQDLLDDIARGGNFNLKKAEKDFKAELLDLVKELE